MSLRQHCQICSIKYYLFQEALSHAAITDYKQKYTPVYHSGLMNTRVNWSNVGGPSFSGSWSIWTKMLSIRLEVQYSDHSAAKLRLIT